MGRQDQKYPEADNVDVFSDQGFFRYTKHTNARGNRKHGKFRIPPHRRVMGNQFSASDTGRDHRAD